ncbi:MAG: 30S ribosomal protein S6 [Aquificaceae bacterium]|nr:30S ribosomal protein S6 [Aquificaceae bacterium]MCS7307324.1 30S ribosomal protein S6 [Aquificaceae bacterium]MCX8076025.1 30S ribosomal protein S6 [Aquificaceae bacterium]MDW8433323.1 30S ribosomal protein S6 [Aquificaceae bacterium]
MARRYYKAVRNYESVVVFKPTLSEEEFQRRLQEIKDFVQKKGGEVLNTIDWGTKQLAYPIKGFNHGRYAILHISSEKPELTNELDFYYKINEDVIRWMNMHAREAEKNAE